MILRHAARRSYTIIDNETVEDTRLSFKALGVLTYLLSKPNDWEIRLAQLAACRGDGAFTVKGALTELQNAGYLTYRRERGPLGRFVSVAVLHETPTASDAGAPHAETAPGDAKALVAPHAETAPGGPPHAETAPGPHAETAPGPTRGNAVIPLNAAALPPDTTRGFPHAETAPLVIKEVVSTKRLKTSAHPLPGAAQAGGEQLDMQVEAPIDKMRGFEMFWNAYPKRNGKRLGRRLCEGHWANLNLGERRAAYRGARIYADACQAGLAGAQDPERFLKHRRWEDWQTPARPERQRGAPAPVTEAKEFFNHRAEVTS